jgi:putative ABC transport system substrate-binding protein
MKRRAFLTLIGGAAASWPGIVFGQDTNTRVAHIAYLGGLSPSTLDPRQIEAFKQGLRENGLIEGSNIKVDYLWGEGNTERVRELAANLGRRDLDVIVSAGTQPVLALMATKTKTPIVFAIVGDPVRSGIVSSLARPGGSVTGLSMSDADLESKRIEVLKETAPAIKRIMVLHDPSMGSIAGVADAHMAAKALSVDLMIVETSAPGEFDSAFARAREQGVDALAVTASQFFNYHRKRLIELAAQYRFPSIWEAAAYVRDGGLLSYGPSFPDMYRRSAGYVAKVLNGAKPADLPVEQPIIFELSINLKTARALGITVPPTLLARADEVIE